MKKSIYILLAFAAIAIAMAGCSKKKGGNGYAYAPGACFNNGLNGYNGLNGMNPGMPYSGAQWVNGQCYLNGQLAPGACGNVVNNYSYNPACSFYGGNQFLNGPLGPMNGMGMSNVCSVYNNGYETFYPVYYSNLGMTVCAGVKAYNYMFTYGTPLAYMGYNNVVQGCIPGNSRCNCNSFGGTMGWFHAGVQLGVCY